MMPTLTALAVVFATVACSGRSAVQSLPDSDSALPEPSGDIPALTDQIVQPDVARLDAMADDGVPDAAHDLLGEATPDVQGEVADGLPAELPDMVHLDSELVHGNDLLTDADGAGDVPDWVESATPDCGQDTCGTLCGTCPEHYACLGGLCVYQPWCGDSTCNPDGGEDCATCPTDCPCACGEECAAGACAFMACEGKECGGDGCGGECGQCGPGEECVEGACQALPTCGLQAQTPFGGHPWRVGASENQLFALSTIDGVHVYDRTEPQEPKEIGLLPAGILEARGVTVTSKSVLAAAGTGSLWSPPCDDSLLTFDLPDDPKLLPTPAGGLQLPGCLNAVVEEDGHAFVTDENNLYVVDVQQPQAPVLVGSVQLPACGEYQWDDLTVGGGYCFVSGQGVDDCVVAVDLSDLISPTVTATIFTGPFSDIAWTENHLLLGGWDGLGVLDVADPSKPGELSVFGVGESVGAIQVLDGVAYLGLGTNLKFTQKSLSIVNISNVLSPTEDGSAFSSVRGTRDISISGDAAYIARYAEIDVYDISNSQEPWLGKRMLFPGGCHFLARGDNNIWMVQKWGYAMVTSLVDDVDGYLVTGRIELDVEPEIYGAVASNDAIYVNATIKKEIYIPGLLVVNIAQPAAPTLAQWMPIEGFFLTALSLSSSSPLLFVALAATGSKDPSKLLVFDVVEPLLPVLLGEVAVGKIWGGGIDSIGKTVFVSGGFESGQLTVVDVSDPAAPHVLVTYDLDGGGRDVAVVGDLVLVAAGSGGLHVFQWTGETLVYLSAWKQSLFDVQAVAAEGNWVAVTAGNGDTVEWLPTNVLTLIDISDPANPVAVDSETLPPLAQCSVPGDPTLQCKPSFHGDDILIPGGGYGMLIYRQSGCW